MTWWKWRCWINAAENLLLGVILLGMGLMGWLTWKELVISWRMW